MVVSGLPVRNGNKHAGEIATMALHLLSSTRDFKVQNLPNNRLQLRLGIHTGLLICFFDPVVSHQSFYSLFLRFRVAQLFQVILHNQPVLTKFRRCMLADIDIRLTIDVIVLRIIDNEGAYGALSRRCFATVELQKFQLDKDFHSPWLKFKYKYMYIHHIYKTAPY